MRQLLNLFKHVSLLFIFFSFPLWAAQVLVMKEQERLEAQVSAKDLNRFQIVGERIASVFGAKGTFALEQEEVKGQVFLKIHDSAPPKMDLSIITESGLTQDMWQPCQGKPFFSNLPQKTRPLIFGGLSPDSLQKALISSRQWRPLTKNQATGDNAF